MDSIQVVMYKLWVNELLSFFLKINDVSKNNIKLDLDINDKLSSFRDKFYHSKNEIYLDGNSLGKKPNQVNSVVENLLNNQWGKNRLLVGMSIG